MKISVTFVLLANLLFFNGINCQVNLFGGPPRVSRAVGPNNINGLPFPPNSIYGRGYGYATGPQNIGRPPTVRIYNDKSPLPPNFGRPRSYVSLGGGSLPPTGPGLSSISPVIRPQIYAADASDLAFLQKSNLPLLGQRFQLLNIIPESSISLSAVNPLRIVRSIGTNPLQISPFQTLVSPFDTNLGTAGGISIIGDATL